MFPPWFLLRKLCGILRRFNGLPRRALVSMQSCIGRRQLVVLDIDAVGLREHFDPLIEWLLKDGRCIVLVAVTDSEFEAYRAKNLPRDSWGKYFCMPKSQFMGLGYKPSVCVSFHAENGSNLAARLRYSTTQRVVMQHGLSDKTAFGEIGKVDPLADFDVVFLAGPVFREGSLDIYRQKHAGTYARLRFMEIGLPKTDLLFKNTVSREKVLVDLGLKPDLPTVCYAPTWEKCASLEQHGVKIIEALGSLPVNVIVKLHHASLCAMPYDWILRDGHGGKDWRKIVGEIESRRQNVKLATGQDGTPYLIASDLLVSDASGIAYEFILLDRPVIFFDVPDLFDTYGKDGIHYWGRESGDIVCDIESLKQATMRNLCDPVRKRADRAKLMNRISYSRGDATEKAGWAILELMNNPRIKRK